MSEQSFDDHFAGNIGNARLAGLEKDLGMAGYDYSIALTAFFASYCLFEVPANLMLKVRGAFGDGDLSPS